MDILQNILGGGGQQRQQQYQDFSTRYDQGDPYDNITDDEALQNYREVAAHLPPHLYEEAAQESFSRLSPQQRQELGQYLMQGAQQRGVSFPDANRDGRDDRMQDPRYLTQMTSQIRQQQPGLFSQLLGGALGGGGGAGGLLGGALGNVMGGGSQMGRNTMGGNTMGGGAQDQIGQVLSNPIARAALAGIAATAVQKMMQQRR